MTDLRLNEHLCFPQVPNDSGAPFARRAGDGPVAAPDGRLRAVHVHGPALGVLGHPHRHAAHQGVRRVRRQPHHRAVPSGRAHLWYRDGELAG